MTRRRRFAVGWAVAALAVGAWSCGGSGLSEGPTNPVAVELSDSSSGVDASVSSGKLTVCHRGRALKVSTNALAGHLGHGDPLGSCAAACPCFTSSGLGEVAALCSSGLTASCPSQYSLSLFCAPGGGGGTIGNLGLFEARLGAGTCSTTTFDLATGNEVTTTLSVSPEEFAACKQAIVGNAFYPSSCPH